MIKVITYGTYDQLHYGHIRLLERAKELGDYLIVGVTADDYDKIRGKINVTQSLEERIAAVRATGLADEIIVEEYDGQKIDDIINKEVDIFTVGSDWVGVFDYLSEYCKVVYLERTQGVSSTEIRSKNRSINLGCVGTHFTLEKFIEESEYANGINVTHACVYGNENIAVEQSKYTEENYVKMLNSVDAVYIASRPIYHYDQIKTALNLGKHVFCEAPVTINVEQSKELFALAKEKNLILMVSLKTAYMEAYKRLILLVKSGLIGDVVSIDATCTSIKKAEDIPQNDIRYEWNSIFAWGPTALLPVFSLLGTDYVDKNIYSKFLDKENKYDMFTKINLTYKNAVASIKVGKGIKSEGELIISGTKGYIYVPAPWWKTDYFEMRFENPSDNKRYFYQMNGSGYRYEIVSFLKAVNESRNNNHYLTEEISNAICKICEEYYLGNVTEI